jgi:hypothetical protein
MGWLPRKRINAIVASAKMKLQKLLDRSIISAPPRMRDFSQRLILDLSNMGAERAAGTFYMILQVTSGSGQVEHKSCMCFF